LELDNLGIDCRGGLSALCPGGAAMTTKHSLAKVTDPQGRIDVLLYQFAGRMMERLERDRGLVGIREHLLPLVEEVIVGSISRRNVIPREVRAFLKVCELNRGRR
jgi:hypothetical protein